MLRTSVILDQLRSATAPAHESLERRLLLARPAPTLSHYKCYLESLYGFVEPLERAWCELPSPVAERVELTKRCKATTLAHDLRDLGSRGTSRCTKLPRVDTEARALGSLYVMEGSTLGARYLPQHLRALPLAPADRYLRSYGEELRPMWNALRQSLTEHVERSPQASDELIGAACDTFACLDEWMVSCGAAEANLGV